MSTRLVDSAASIESAVDQLTAAIKIAIRDARIAPGQRLIETDLMAEFSVSRGTVREALRRLDAEGLVQHERFRGASVRRMSRQQVVELSSIRGAMEGLAAALAAKHLDRNGRERLLRLHERGKAITESRKYDTYNHDLHEFICELSGNRELPQFIAYTRLAIFRLQFASILLTPDRMERSWRDHDRIVSAIVDLAPGRAEAEMKAHIENSTRGILAAPHYYFASD